MVWVPGTDYPPAQRHVGYPVAVTADGTDTGATALHDGAAVIGWRAGCDGGWRGHQFYPRVEWPSATGAVPAAVEGWEDVTATCGQWVRHVRQAVSGLSIYELARHLADTRCQLTAAVNVARRAGLSWAQIGGAAGISAEHAARQWGDTRAGTDRAALARGEGPAPRPGREPTR